MKTSFGFVIQSLNSLGYKIEVMGCDDKLFVYAQRNDLLRETLIIDKDFPAWFYRTHQVPVESFSFVNIMDNYVIPSIQKDLEPIMESCERNLAIHEDGYEKNFDQPIHLLTINNGCSDIVCSHRTYQNDLDFKMLEMKDFINHARYILFLNPGLYSLPYIVKNGEWNE